MAPVEGDVTSSQNCSCTSCFYKSESDHPSVRKMMAQGSRIDRLYIGKYIPLREWKLLDKLVRTRAVYDDVRNQLISGSNININKKADLKPKHKLVPTDKEFDDIEKSGAILELVDLVDKGAVLGPKTISECCSCCFCSSNTLLPEHTTKRRRHRHEHRHRHDNVYDYRREHGHKHGDVRESSNASDISGHGIGMESRRTKNLRIVAKQIRSDPCACSTKLSGMIKRRSKAMLKKLRAERPDPRFDESYDFERTDTRQRRWHEQKSKMKKSLREIKQTHEMENEISKFRLLNSLTKVNESKAKLKNNFETGAKRSLDKMKTTKIKMKENLKTRIKESVQKMRPISDQLKSNIEENIFKVKKDSITKFREKLNRKRQSKKNKKQIIRHRKHEKSSGDMSNVSDISIQARKMEITAKAGTKPQKLISRKIENTKVSPETRISIDFSTKKGIKQEIISKTQDKVTKSKEAGRQDIISRDQEHRRKLKGVGKEVVNTKKHEKGTVSTRKGRQELATQIQEKRIKSKGINKQENTAPKNEKLKKPKSVKSMMSVPSIVCECPTEKITKELNKTAHKTSSLSSISEKPAKIRSANEGIVKQISDENEYPHQAVKIASSFSFSIEFSKDKPSSKTNVEQNDIPLTKHKVKTRNKGQEQMRLTNHYNKYADARHKLLAKDTQADLALKRCFCTLKLKAKRTKSNATKSKLIAANMTSESVTEAEHTRNQSTSAIKERPLQPTYELLPYECEPFVCIPGECNPIKCEKKIKKRDKKHHTARTNTDYSVKSTPSLTSRSYTSTNSRKNQAFSSNKPKKTVSSTSNFTSKPDDSLKPHKQAVRISSSFSFNIEFNKEKQSDASEKNNDLQYKSKTKDPPIKTRKNKIVNQAKQHLKHKQSQMSSSTGKSKYTITKHSLRRCFCTLKLAKTGENRKRGEQLSKSTITSSKNIRHKRYVQPEARSRYIATDKETFRNKPGCQLLPYQCEPGICEPGYCNPYDCLEVLKRRGISCVKRCNIQSNTDKRKIRSTSSLTSRSVTPSKAKKIQSTLTAYKSEVPVHYTKKITSASREVKTVPISPNKQVVRIGSSFSFDIEFFKEKSPASKIPVDNIQKQTLTKKERGLQGNIKRHHKSTLIEKKERSVMIGPALKRCFCTLKLHKTGKLKKLINTSNTGTETPAFKNKIYPENASKATKTYGKFKHTQRLEPYECETNFCVPGDCEPYECLERIKKRDVVSREFGITTDRSKMRTTSSIAQQNSSFSKKVQINTKENKTKAMKRRKLQKAITPSEKTKRSSNIFPEKLSRQAVTIGSNFSFDIQFKKDSFGNKDEDKIVSVNSFDRSIKKLKNRGENPLKLQLTQRESQGDMPRKNRATGVGRMLKRCFCTLKLQNAQKKQRRNSQIFTHLKSPKIYAVNRIAFADNKLIRPSIPMTDRYVGYRNNIPYKNNGYFYETKESTLLDQSFSQTVMKQTLQLKSNITSRMMFLKEINDFDVYNRQVNNIKTESQLSIERYWQTDFNNFDSFKYHDSQILGANSNTSNIQGFSKYLNQNFCTMNIQVPGRDKSKKSKSSTSSTDLKPKANVRNKWNKLEPYECEPGFCIPYQCDPIECQKRIMNRLMKGVCKMSGTDIRSKSSSAYTTLSTANLKGKKIQSNRSRPTRDTRETRQGITYETVPTSRRQAVRVGSKFSFDIEFSKNRTQSPVKKINKPKHSNKKLKAVDVKLKTKGTKGNGGSRHHRESQSMAMKLQDRASNISPMLKRCFCTLKLQKKGKQQKEIAKNVNQGTVTPPNTFQDIIEPRYLNAAQNTSTPRAHKLLPYECEPNICVPGQCDPYECLELIKKRKLKTKNSGTDCGRSISTTSSMINEKKKNKGKHVQSNLKHKPKIKNLKKDPATKSIVTHATKPSRQSRQAVRIGSSFSFDVEFYKDRKYHGDQVPKKALKYISKPREKKIHERKSKQIGREKKFKDRSFQDSKPCTDKDCQMECLEKFSKSSMTNAAIKRCFCTLKAFKPVKKHVAAAGTETEAVSRTPHNKLERDIAIQHGRKYRPPLQLDPNECEPGICIPDECDPYVCEQIIKKRNATYDSKTTGTERVMTRSVSSTIRSRLPKLKQAQSQPERATSKVKLAKPVKPVKQKSSQDYSTSDKYHLPMSTNRQAVRIGSTFSFDIEFYKEKSPHYRQVQAAAKAIKEKPLRKQVKSRKVKTTAKTNNKGVTNKEISLRSQDSQAQTIKQQNQGSGVGPVLKRCFCTLKLHKQNKQENTNIPSKKIIPSVQTKSVMTVTNKTPIKYSLKPYECEPGVCIPGECDPYECDKLIQKRNRKDSSTTMRHQKRRSTSSWTKSSGKNKNKNIQNADKHKKRRQHNNTSTKLRQPKISEDITNNKFSKQAVKIGSNFSFNVEFFKDKTYGSGDIQQRFAKKRYDTKESTNSTSIKQRHQKSQRAKGVRHMDSQVFAQKMRSTMTGVSPFLKRCFCTLKLHKEGNKKHINTKTSSTDMEQRLKLEEHAAIGTTNKGTCTNKSRAKQHSPRKLEPYECEPGVCVPYECNPYECEKRIKKRLMSSRHSSTDKYKGHSVSIFSSDSVSSSAKKTQATYHPRERKTRKDHRKSQRKELKTSNANSNKQAVKIGSNFSFNVEFFKDRSQERNVIRERDTQKYPLDNDKKYKMKEVATKLKTKNSAAFREGISLHNRHSQAEGVSTESKSSGMGPLLKRCFCTLKLQKEGYNQHIKKDIRGTTMSKYSPVIEARNINVSTAIGRHIRPLEPYVCEKNVRGSRKCDPFECEKRIKRRKKEYGSRTSTSTSQGPRIKLNVPKANFSKEAKNYKMKNSFDSTVLGRKSVGFASDLSINVEFFKSKPQNDNDINRKQPKDSNNGPLVKNLCTLILRKISELYANKKSNHNKPPTVSTQSKATSTKIKKISHTLDPYECEPLSCIPGECDPHECLKRIQERDTSHKSMNTQLRPQCKSKKMQANSIRKNDGISMIVEQPRFSMNRPAVRIGSNISFNIEFYKENVPFNELVSSGIKKKKNTNYTESPEEDVQTENKSSVIVNKLKRCFCTAKLHKPNELDTSDIKQTKGVPKEISLKHKYVPRKSVKSHNNESQVKVVKTENKPSLINNSLKRCFCTAKPRKPSTHNRKRADRQNCVCVNPVSFVQKSPFFKPVQCYFQFQHPNKNDPKQKCFEVCAVHYGKSKDTKSVGKETNDKKKFANKINQLDKSKNEKNLSISKEYNDSRQMETILPYTPSKFKKSDSKSLLPLKKRDEKRKSVSNTNKKPALDDKKINDKSTVSNIPENRRLTAKKGKKSIKLKPLDTIILKSNPLHELMCRCKQIFTKQNKAMPSRNVINISNLTKAGKRKHDVCPQAEMCMCSRNLQADILKISKSERSAKNQKASSETKKSKSLKGAKVSNQRKCSDECRYKVQEKRKFSIFQGGDAEQTHLNLSGKNLNKEHRKDGKKRIVRFSRISLTKSKKQILNTMPDNSQENNSNRPYKKCRQCNEEKKTDNFEDNINKIPTRLSSFVSKCFCKLSNMTKGNSEQMKITNQRIIEQKKLQKFQLQARSSQTCPDCNKIKNANRIPLSSGDGRTTPVPTLTRLNKTNCLCEKTKHQRKSLPEINISGSKVILPNKIIPKYRNNKSPVIIKSIQYTNIQKKQENHLPVIKISNDMITYPESLLAPTHSSAIRFQNREASKHKTVPCAKICVKPKKKMPKTCTCGNSTCAKLSMKRQLDEQEEQCKAKLNTKPCICGSSTCAKETKKRLLDAEKKLNKLKVPKCICKSLVCAGESLKRLSQKKKFAAEAIPDSPCICGSSLCAQEKKRLSELRKEKNKVKEEKDPCICKFPPCAKERKRLMEIQKNEKTIKSTIPCICGSKICIEEAKKMLESKLKSKGKGKKKHPNDLAGMSENDRKNYNNRLKIYEKEDAMLRKKRLKEQKGLDEQLYRLKNAGDCQILAESAIDVCKLTRNVASDILRGSYRAITDHQRTKMAIRTAVKQPKKACAHLKQSVIDTGALSTKRRLGRRCASMKKVKLMKSKLEQYAVTNFLLHMADTDPKKRLNKKKKPVQKPQHEPLDFGCSLYMASLRRRPYLAVYYLCPWFYPHFISLLTVMKQFFDMVLFLLAVCVWSPCIVGMEMCRAIMCCFFCTG